MLTCAHTCATKHDKRFFVILGCLVCEHHGQTCRACAKKVCVEWLPSSVESTFVDDSSKADSIQNRKELQVVHELELVRDTTTTNGFWSFRGPDECQEDAQCPAAQFCHFSNLVGRSRCVNYALVGEPCFIGGLFGQEEVRCLPPAQCAFVTNPSKVAESSQCLISEVSSNSAPTDVLLAPNELQANLVGGGTSDSAEQNAFFIPPVVFPTTLLQPCNLPRASGGKGCSDNLAVEQCVCKLDKYCCDTHWDNGCAELAISYCEILAVASKVSSPPLAPPFTLVTGPISQLPVQPSSESALASTTDSEAYFDDVYDSDNSSSSSDTDPYSMSLHGGCCKAGSQGGCVDERVQTCVCAIDQFCCTLTWDELCAHLAQFDCQASCLTEPTYSSTSSKTPKEVIVHTVVEPPAPPAELLSIPKLVTPPATVAVTTSQPLLPASALAKEELSPSTLASGSIVMAPAFGVNACCGQYSFCIQLKNQTAFRNTKSMHQNICFVVCENVCVLPPGWSLAYHWFIIVSQVYRSLGTAGIAQLCTVSVKKMISVVRANGIILAFRLPAKNVSWSVRIHPPVHPRWPGLLLPPLHLHFQSRSRSFHHSQKFSLQHRRQILHHVALAMLRLGVLAWLSATVCALSTIFVARLAGMLAARLLPRITAQRVISVVAGLSGRHLWFLYSSQGFLGRGARGGWGVGWRAGVIGLIRDQEAEEMFDGCHMKT